MINFEISQKLLKVEGMLIENEQIYDLIDKL